MEFTEKKVLVFGTGISGVAAANLLENAGAEVVLFDGNEKLDKAHVLENFTESKTPELYVGVLPEEVEKELDLVVLSPGVPVDLPLVLRLKEAGLPIWGEIELAYRCKKGDVLAITGTNGKTTTTALLGEIMKTAYPHVHVVGNIGIPYTGVVTEDTDDTVTVAEISSFQLETIDAFCPCVSAILNITPDHLDRHKTMECYIQVKEGITRNQTEEDCCVLNYEDPVLREFGKTLKCKVLYFSSKEKLDEGIFMDGDFIVYRHDGKNEKVLDVNELNIIGRHNHENVMTAVAIAIHLGVPMDMIREACREFKAVEHRIEYVRERFGVTYYNDSIGTSPTRTIAGLRSFNQKLILIAGGYDKHIPYEPLAPEVIRHVKTLILMGATGPRIEKVVREHPDFAASGLVIEHADNMQHAVELARAAAHPGDEIILSPASASFDLYPNFEVRGREFKKIVNELK